MDYLVKIMDFLLKTQNCRSFVQMVGAKQQKDEEEKNSKLKKMSAGVAMFVMPKNMQGNEVSGVL